MSQLNFTIYRSVEPKPNTTDTLHEYRTTMRPPGNVPYVVDNLWEWKRPDNFPCRRIAVFANQQMDLAKKSGPDEGIVYRVEFNERFKLCVVKGYQDSKYHPDCKKLKKALFSSDFLGKDWLNDRKEKNEIGKLWIPCLTKDEINSLVKNNNRLKEIKEKIYDAITYWDSVELIGKGMDSPDPEGELFFEAEDGYYLKA